MVIVVTLETLAFVAAVASCVLALIGFLYHLSHRLEVKIDGLGRELRTAIHAGEAALRTEMREGNSALREELKRDIGEVRDELKRDIREVRTTVDHLGDRMFTLATRRGATRPRPAHR